MFFVLYFFNLHVFASMQQINIHPIHIIYEVNLIWSNIVKVNDLVTGLLLDNS